MKLVLTVATTSFLIAAGMIQGAKADIVYDNEVNATPDSRTYERDNTRQVLQSAQKFRATNRSPEFPAVQVQVAPVQQAPNYAMSDAGYSSQVLAAAPEVQSLSKSEMLRRERVREELRNEDAIQERLEELRLRDEQRRTSQLFTASENAAPVETFVQPAPMAATPVYSGQPTIPRQDVVGMSQAAPMQTQQVQQVAPAQSSTNASDLGAIDEERTIVKLSPRIGVPNMSSSNQVTVGGRYSLGVGLSLGASDSTSFEIGYLFSEYGLTLPSNGVGFSAFPTNTGIKENRVFKQNVVDAGLKIALMGKEAKLRPFIAGGGAWSKGYVNFADDYKTWLSQLGYNTSNVLDFETTSYLGYLGAGIDFRVTRTVNIGAGFRYYTVLSSTTNNSTATNGFNGGQVAGVDYGNAIAGAAVNKSNFYTILGTVSFEL